MGEEIKDKEIKDKEKNDELIVRTKLKNTRYKIGVPFQVIVKRDIYYFVTKKGKDFDKSCVRYFGKDPSPNTYKQFYDNDFNELTHQQSQKLKRSNTYPGSIDEMQTLFEFYSNSIEVTDNATLAQLALVGAKLDRINLITSRLSKIIKNMKTVDSDTIDKINDIVDELEIICKAVK